mgnify:CR=1 FL=1
MVYYSFCPILLVDKDLLNAIDLFNKSGILSIFLLIWNYFYKKQLT